MSVFLEMMAEDPIADPKTVASLAIMQADAFSSAYIAWGWKQAAPEVTRLRGCRACYGSGGKLKDPCKVCGGTGKVPK